MKEGVFGNFTKNHTKTPMLESFLIKFAGLKPVTSLKNSLWHRRFPVNFAKFLRTPFFIEHLWWLLLAIPSLVTPLDDCLCIAFVIRTVFPHGHPEKNGIVS